MPDKNTIRFPLDPGRMDASGQRTNLRHVCDLLYTLVVRDLKVRYEGSVIGVAWSAAYPLLLLLVFQFLFHGVLGVDVPRYSSFAFTGILVWTWVQTGLTQSAGAVTGSRELVRRPGFPLAILPAVAVSTAMIHFLLGLPILALFIVFGGGQLHLSALALPMLVALQCALLLGAGYLLAAANVLFRDTQHLLSLLLQILFFLTPIFYEASAVPARYRSLYNLNPLVPLVEGYRAILLHGALPDSLSLAALAAFAAVLLYVGHRFFVQVSTRFVEML